MSPEKYVLLRAKELEMSSKSHEVDGAEEHRQLRGGECRLLRGALCGLMFTARQLVLLWLLHVCKIGPCKRRSLGKV